MKLTKLQLENFRSYNKYLFEFEDDKNCTIIVGPNGRGKTNLLEAIHVLSLGKSFRTIYQDDLVNWDQEYMRCNAGLKRDNEEIQLEVFYSSLPLKKKNFKKNGVNLRNSEYIGNLLTVLFHPEDLNMLYLSPSLRRRYLDTILCQTDKKYLNALSKYKKVLKQRNALLHKIRETRFERGDISRLLEDLEAWDCEFLEFGSYISQKRTEFIDFILSDLEKTYQKISDSLDTINIKYDKHPFTYKELNKRRDKDIYRAESSCGPHRDDLKFFLNGKEISGSASRGEFRTLLLAIKLGEITYIKEKTGQNPVLLLDDVFSELDSQRQKQLLKAIKGCQTIITTTDVNELGQLTEESTIILID